MSFSFVKIVTYNHKIVVKSAEAVEYSDSISAEG